MENHKNYSSFIGYLRHKMIFEEPSNDELKGLLDKRILDIKIHEDRMEFLDEIDELKKAPNVDAHYKGIIQDFFDYVKLLIEDEESVSQERPEAQEKKYLLRIPTKATSEQVLNFWLKLQGNNEKGEPYWDNKGEIEHFVNQNFEGFEGVDEIKDFCPNMNKTEIYHVTWSFFDKFGKIKTKRQYVNLLLKNFTRFKHTKNIYPNIADKSIRHLSNLFK